MTALALAACSGDAADPGAPFGPCDGRVTAVPLEPGVHVQPGTEIDFSTNPPASGTHYFFWGAWGRSYDDPPLARGYWLHDAEHGGVVLLYHCPEGCANERESLVQFIDSLPVDSHCEPPIRNRTLLAADPLLPDGVRVAAVAWGFSYTASCVDAPSLRAFFDEHYGEGPENTCADGIIP